MKSLSHLIEYYLLLIFANLIQFLNLKQSHKIAEFLADITYYILRIRKKVVLDNLYQSFKQEKSEKELLNIAHASYRQFAKTMVELLYFPKLKKKELLEMVQFENIDILENALKQGRGAVLVGGHFGNWELMGAALAQIFPVTFVVGKQSNTLVDNLLNSYRINKGINIIPLKMALRGVLKTLKKNEFIAILADQDAHSDGVFVNFFNRPASTPKGPALFAIRARCPIITGHIFRLNGKFKVLFELVNKPSFTENEEDNIKNYTQEYVNILEKHIREYPDHWFWMHRRWKTKPLK